jgi:hypothetical protein
MPRTRHRHHHLNTHIPCTCSLCSRRCCCQRFCSRSARTTTAQHCSLAPLLAHALRACRPPAACDTAGSQRWQGRPAAGWDERATAADSAALDLPQAVFALAGSARLGPAARPRQQAGITGLSIHAPSPVTRGCHLPTPCPTQCSHPPTGASPALPAPPCPSPALPCPLPCPPLPALSTHLRSSTTACPADVSWYLKGSPLPPLPMRATSPRCVASRRILELSAAQQAQAGGDLMGYEGEERARFWSCLQLSRHRQVGI